MFFQEISALCFNHLDFKVSVTHEIFDSFEVLQRVRARHWIIIDEKLQIFNVFVVSNFRDELLFNDVYFIRSELNPKLSGFEISCLFSEHFFANWKGIDDDFVG